MNRCTNGPVPKGQGRKAHRPNCHCQVGLKYIYKFRGQELCESCGWALIRRVIYDDNQLNRERHGEPLSNIP